MTCKEYNDFVGKVSRIRAKICEGTNCGNCILKGSPDFSNNPCYVSNSGFTEEQFDFIKNYDFTDWSKVPIDAKIVVHMGDEKITYNRHFAGYENGVIYAWDSGQTSFTTAKKVAWKYAELYQEEP